MTAAPSEYDTKPRHERQPEEAWIEESRLKPAADGPGPGVTEARQAFVAALLGE